MPHTLKAQPRFNGKLLCCLGIPALARLTGLIKSRNSNLSYLTVNSPTQQPINHVVDEISCQNVSIYAQGILNYQGNSKIQNCKIAKIRNRTQDLLVVCVAKRLIPLDHIGLLFSAQIGKYKLERTSSCQSISAQNSDNF